MSLGEQLGMSPKKSQYKGTLCLVGVRRLEKFAECPYRRFASPRHIFCRFVLLEGIPYQQSFVRGGKMNIADAKYVIEKNPEIYFGLTGRHDALLSHLSHETVIYFYYNKE